jgi:hypothetical protein
MTNFTADTYQNQYLATGATRVDALVSVTASGTSGAPRGHESAELIMVDVSGSMNFPRSKIKAAVAATCAAVDCIRDGVLFAVIAGTDEARQVSPSEDRMVAASPATREQTKEKVRKLKAGGGTAIGSWLGAGRALLGDGTTYLAHALLLTDGENQNETPEELAAAVAECEGVFQCDCRGVGSDWVASELRTISSGLLGTVEAIREPEDLAADFTATMERAMARGTGNVALRVWTPKGARVELVQQVSPTLEDLTHRRDAVDDREGDYPTGAWSDETRDYHVAIEVPARAVGEEMLAGRIKLLVDDEVLSEARILATWTDDAALSTKLNHELAHYTGQARYASVIDQAYEAKYAGDDDLATHLFGQAVAIAEEIGDTYKLQGLAKVVDIIDAGTGTVKLKANVDAFDDNALQVDSIKTNRLPPT